jgi:hypothetical protein
VVRSPWLVVICQLSVGVGFVTAAHVIRVGEFHSPCYKGQRTADEGRSEEKATCRA